MLLYLVRHGIAVDVDGRAVTRDEDRNLSPAGVRKTRAIAEGLAGMECAPARIVSSPLLRAAETAEIMASVLAKRVSVELFEGLAGHIAASETVAWLHKQPEQDTMLVGHMPHIAELAAHLLCDCGHIDIEFRKGAVCCLSFEGRANSGGARLEWLMQPGFLRRLA